MLDVSRHAVDYWLRQRILQRLNKSSDTYTDNIKKTQKTYTTQKQHIRRRKRKCLFTAHELNWMSWPEQVDPVTRHIHWSCASASRLCSVLIGCSETRTVSAPLVLNTPIPMRLFNWGSVHVSCKQTLKDRPGVRRRSSVYLLPVPSFRPHRINAAYCYVHVVRFWVCMYRMGQKERP